MPREQPKEIAKRQKKKKKKFPEESFHPTILGQLWLLLAVDKFPFSQDTLQVSRDKDDKVKITASKLKFYRSLVIQPTGASRKTRKYHGFPEDQVAPRSLQSAFNLEPSYFPFSFSIKEV